MMSAPLVTDKARTIARKASDDMQAQRVTVTHAQ